MPQTSLTLGHQPLALVLRDKRRVAGLPANISSLVCPRNFVLEPDFATDFGGFGLLETRLRLEQTTKLAWLDSRESYTEFSISWILSSSKPQTTLEFFGRTFFPQVCLKKY